MNKETNHTININGKWLPAKQIPYQPYGIEKLKCNLGFHELRQSQKYAYTKFCFRCGKREYNEDFDY